jgi:hypothetical protein
MRKYPLQGPTHKIPAILRSEEYAPPPRLRKTWMGRSLDRKLCRTDAGGAYSWCGEKTFDTFEAIVRFRSRPHIAPARQ